MSITSDDFSAAVLDALWSQQGPNGSIAVTAANGEGYLEIAVPQGNYNAWHRNDSTRLLQAAPDEDFSISARFLSTPTHRYQIQGLLVEQDAGNWIRFDIYHDGDQQHVFAGVTVDGESSRKIDTIIPDGNASHLRVDRAGDLWRLAYSADGETWITADSFTHDLVVTAVGPFAAVTGSAPGYTAQVDYVFNTTAPVADEDAGVSLAADDTAVTRIDTALVLVTADDLLANDGEMLALSGFTQPDHGTVIDNGDGTLTYTPASGFTGTDAFTYSVDDGTAVHTARVDITVTAPGMIVSDDFRVAPLDAMWSLQGPDGSITLAAADGQGYLEIAVPRGDHDAWGTNHSVRLMQAAPDRDFGIAAGFLSTPAQRHQVQGLLVEQDADNWIRFDTHHDGARERVFAAVTVDGVSSMKVNTTVASDSAAHLRVDRTGDVWTFAYSADGVTWTTAEPFTHDLTVAAVGLFAAATEESPGHAAAVDYFFNTAAPIANEDAGVPLTAGSTMLGTTEIAVIVAIAVAMAVVAASLFRRFRTRDH